MLTDEKIEKYIQPLIERQQQVNLFVIKVIAERIKKIGELLPSDLYKISRIVEFGADILKIKNEIARITKLQLADISKIISETAKESYFSAKANYFAQGIEFKPIEENKNIQNIIKSVTKATQSTYKNLSNAQAFMLRDPKNPKKLTPTSVSDTYDRVVDTAIQAVKSQAVDYNAAMRDTVKQLNNSGIRCAEYVTEKGRYHTQRLDTAVRRNLMDGVRAIAQGVQDETGKQFNSDGVELTVHENPAPDHAPVQGHQFSSEEFQKLQSGKDFHDVNGKHFKGFERSIGLWNCYHFYFPIVIGVNFPVYSQEQLDEVLKRNEKGVTFEDGKHLTMYKCTQEQRRMETEIRHAKEAQIAAETAGDTELASKYRSVVRQKTTKYTAFSKKCGLRPKYDRLAVPGYGNKKVDKSVKSGIIKKTDKFIIPTSKIDNFLLKPGAKHSKEFFDVGYTTDHGQRLFNDIKNGFDVNKATDFKKGYENSNNFSIFMELGITKRKMFRTVWEQKNGQKPKFVTAHREDEK